MKPPCLYALGVLISAAWLLLTPSPGMSQPEQAGPEAPRAERVWVSQGLFATKLASALKLADTDNEAEAMRELSWFKIAPRGGWIADRPVTPGTLRELRKDVSRAAEEDRFFMNTQEALGQLDQVVASLGLSFDSPEDTYADRYEADNEPPPAARYYYPYPPSAYYDLYPWYPYPFAWSHWYFPGFYFMYDYHSSPHRRHHPYRRPPRAMERR